jgi:hypothetical protein
MKEVIGYYIVHPRYQVSIVHADFPLTKCHTLIATIAHLKPMVMLAISKIQGNK